MSIISFTKFEVYSESQSVAAQKQLFRHGFRWITDQYSIRKDVRFFFLHRNSITNTNSVNYFDIYEYKLITVEDVFSAIPKPEKG